MVLLVTVASLGNTIGAIINWFLGRGVARSVVRLEKIHASTPYSTVIKYYKKYGQWTLLFSWAPFIGNPITIIAGIFKVPLKTFLLIVAIAKTSGYVIIAIFAKRFVLRQ
tara:strand:- start:106 stop:435 length:330 start_codon:yes stop_codon:yes gene_type:complete